MTFPKSRRCLVVLAALTVLAVAAFIVGCGPAGQATATTNPEPVVATPEGVSPQTDGPKEPADLPPLPPKEPPQYPNLDSNLNRLAEVASATLTPAVTGAAPSNQDDEPVLVTFYIETSRMDDVRRYLEGNDIFVRNVGEDYIEAHVPPSQLGAASEQPGVLRVDTVVPALPPQPTSANLAAPAVISDGVGIHGADAWHGAGFHGENVKVGVIDIGFEGFARLQGTQLPRNVVARCYFATARVPSSALADCEVDGNHGTTVAETLSDVAPNVTLYIANPITTGDLRSVVEWMAGQGVQVINLSLEYSPDGPGDGSSPNSNSPLNIIDFAISRGITWVTAGGNRARTTWYGAFADTDGDGWHNFAKRDEGNTFTVSDDEEVIAFMRWDDSWGRADCDLDLTLHEYDPSASTPELLAISEDFQYGGANQYPREIVKVSVPPGDYSLSIWNARCDTMPAWIQLTAWIDNDLQHFTPGHHMGNPAEGRNPGMMAVGATNWWDTQQVAEYSSRGPTTDGRVKPDITGITCNPTVTNPPMELPDAIIYPTCGTSHAAPHITGLAALVKQRFTDYRPDSITHYLKQNAAERGAAGADNTWGYGLAELPDPSLAPVSVAAAPAGNITAVNGRNTGEAVIAWDAAPGATHYRIGCVNMERDYPRAKASNTGNWREAFLYFDVEAQNLDPIRPTYTFPGLQEGVYHACTVLSNNSRYGQPTWPEVPPYWQYLTITDLGGACPICAVTPP